MARSHLPQSLPSNGLSVSGRGASGKTRMSDELPWEVGTVSFVSGQGWATIKTADRKSREDDVHVPSTKVLALRTGMMVEFRRAASVRGWEARSVRIIE